MNIHIPPAIQGLTPVLSEFVEGMVHKLNVNSHRDKIDDRSVDSLIDYLMGELKEFRDQLREDDKDANTLSELHDMGNFCFLLYAFLRQKGVMDLKERFIRDFYTIDAATGRVFCKQTRSGSPLKVGDEVVGTSRNGVTFIRAQHTASGASIYVARRDLVWWEVHGEWPAYPLVYIDGGEYSGKFNGVDGFRTKDRISNLTVGPIPEKKYPYVSRYAPKGREGTANWGRWVYQRRHKYKLVRCGYYDTEEQAAVEGLKAWKEQTRNA